MAAAQAALRQARENTLAKKGAYYPQISAGFSASRNLEPGKVLVTFLAAEPSPEARTMLANLKHHPEELHLKGRELYIYFPNGAGQSKLPWSKVEKLTKVAGTARNWNSVTRMLAIAEEMESAE